MGNGRLEGRVAIVTGAGRGIGRAIVQKLVSEGARVLANDRDADVLAELVGDRRLKVGIDAARIGFVQALIPLGRVGTPTDAAGAVYLFCLPESDYISGEVVVTAGGLRM